MGQYVSFQLVDAFADTPFTGNPAGVVPDADGLSDKQMQLIAREVNASETAFIRRAREPGAAPRLRWFTPAVEVGFCGHATLAAAHVWAAGRLRAVGAAPSAPGASDRAGAAPEARTTLEFDSAAGRLELVAERLPDREDLLWWLTMPAPELRPDHTNPVRLCEALGLANDDLDPAAAPARTRDHDVIVLIRSWQRLQALRPDMQALASLSERFDVRGVCVATRQTLSPFVNVASRFFAPAAGIAEDPVTGSVHGPLAALLVQRGLVPIVDGRAALHCVQGIPGGRTGVLRALVEATPNGPRVQIAGVCHTTVRGEMRLPKS